ncbi:hypothetical protein STEG23_003633, partial [Scotinomys teguina]
MQNDIGRDAQTGPLLPFREVAKQNKNRRWLTSFLGGRSQEEEHEWPPLNVMCDLGTSYKDKVGIGDLTGIVLRDTSPGNTMGEHDRRRSEVQAPAQQQSIFKPPPHISRVVNQKPKQKTSIGEAMPLKQMKSINKTSESEEICEEVDNNIELKPIPRFSEKPGPSVPGTTIKDYDSTSVIKNVSTDPEIKILNRESVPPGLPPEDRSKDTMMGHRYTQGDHPTKKEKAKIDCGLPGKTKMNVLVEEPLPKASKGQTHYKNMTKQKKNHDGKDAHVHSRLPFLRRKEEVEEQDDWHHTQLMDLLREDIKEIVKEQLAIEFIRMRQLLQKDLAEITRQFQNELRQTVMENMALLQEQVKETQQELWKLHLQQKELFKEDLKEMIREEIKNSKIAIFPKEEPLPEATKGTAAFQ